MISLRLFITNVKRENFIWLRILQLLSHSYLHFVLKKGAAHQTKRFKSILKLWCAFS